MPLDILIWSTGTLAGSNYELQGEMVDLVDSKVVRCMLHNDCDGVPLQNVCEAL